MDPQQSSKNIFITAIVALAVGITGGFFYGKAQGRKEAFAEAESARTRDANAAQQDFVEAANPFAKKEPVNPFEGAYKNPFKGAAVNPFAGQ